MNLRSRYRFSLAALAVPVLAALSVAGCDRGAAGDPTLLQALNTSYEEALNLSAGSGHRFAAGSPEESAVLNRLQQFFSGMTPESVRTQVAEVYAPNAYLNDNVVGIFGANSIADYFAHAAGQTDVLNITFVDIARSDTDYYIRWQMTVQAAALNDGDPVVSYGTTQFRFDAEGRVLVHKDFWDAATGVYEHLPYVGPLMNYVHRKLGGAAAALSFDQ